MVQSINQIDSEGQESTPNTPKAVETYKDVEKFKLGIWLAKTFSLFSLAMIAFIISVYGYVAVTSHVLVDLAGLNSLLNGFFDIIKAVVSP
jgi:hypothetical protein